MAISDKSDLLALPGLGLKSVSMLTESGILNVESLRELGAIEAYLQTKRAGKNPSMNFLYALEGALTNRSWIEVKNEEKHRLLTALDAYQKSVNGG